MQQSNNTIIARSGFLHERRLAAAQRLSSVATGIYSGGVVRYIADQIHTHPCILRSMEMEMQLASMAMAWWPARLASRCRLLYIEDHGDGENSDTSITTDYIHVYACSAAT